MPALATLLDGKYGALLFDMDGTILNSITVAERIWGAWALRHGLDPAAFLPTIHGARAADTISRLALPGVDADVEAQRITAAEIADVDGILEIAGAAAFLRSLPDAKWAVVTSAPKALAVERLKAAHIPLPAIMVTSEDVIQGKPNPECYLLAARQLGVNIGDCLIFEDASAGILAAEAAGAKLMIITSTHTHALATTHATIGDYATLRASIHDDGFIRLAHSGGI